MKLVLSPADLSFEQLEAEYNRRKALKAEEAKDAKAFAMGIAKRIYATYTCWWAVTNFEANFLGWVYGTLSDVEASYLSSNDAYHNYATPQKAGKKPANYVPVPLKANHSTEVCYCDLVNAIAEKIAAAENEADLPKDLAEAIKRLS